ncbi:5-hydroxytryptamine receptor 3E-like [Stegastes partitus]|uniref:5-hydroxytryptamine receptor 3E-like n=1 Tax=Stegastes partitus TaxID=144197 RepID=A0A9Y4NA89_9TELE|nr:PREDICTED: 5-hydroxytryptamine receptor 3E-like [Stegastes partitus]
MLNCSSPDTLSLLAALQPVFKLNPIRPVMNLSTTTNVSVSFIMIGILGVDEKAQVLTTYIWQSMTWRNEFTTWDVEECGTPWISVQRKLLWVPDMVINEFMGKNSAPFAPYSYLAYDGMVYDAQPVRVVSSCRLDIYLFPFDIQNCSLSYNSYLHGLKAIEPSFGIPVELMFKLSKEVMATMAAAYLSSPQVTVKRRATLYVVNILIPSCFLVTVDLFSFMLPPKKVDRSLFKMTLILGYTVFLLMMNDLLPITGDVIPLLNVFLSLCLGLMVASLLETILITNLICGSAHYSPVPRWIRVLVLHILGRLVRLPPKPRDKKDTVFRNPAVPEFEMKVPPPVAKWSEAPEEKEPLNDYEALQELWSLGRDLQAVRLQVEQQLTGSRSTEEWIQVGLIIDRLLFIVYILFLTVSFITIIIIWVNSYNNL